jgi:hypothetical protein
MSPSVSTEIQGWRQALADRPTRRALLSRLLWSALCLLGGVLGATLGDPLFAALWGTLGILALLLARLRLTGRP